MVLVRLVICLDLGQIGNGVISLWGCLWVRLGCRMFSRIILGLGFIIVSCTSSVIRIYSISIFSHRLSTIPVHITATAMTHNLLTMPYNLGVNINMKRCIMHTIRYNASM